MDNVQSLSQLDEWEVDSNTFASMDADKDSLLLQGGYFHGTSSVLCHVNDTCAETFSISAEMFVRAFESADVCWLDYSTDDGATWHSPLIQLEDGDDIPGTPNYDGVSASITTQGEGDGLWVRLTLAHVVYWDYCYLRYLQVTAHGTIDAVGAGSTTIPPEYNLPIKIFATNFLCAATLDSWAFGAWGVVQHVDDRMCLQNTTADYVVDTDLAGVSEVDVYAVFTALGLAPGDNCTFDVSFDGFGGTSSHAVLDVQDGQDTGAQVGGMVNVQAPFAQDQYIYLRVTAHTLSGECCLHATGVSGTHVTTTTTTTP